MNLIIDTTGQKALVALGDAKGVLSFGEWLNGQDLSQKLQPEIDKLLKLTKKKPEAIFCVTGPGSFTSIRIGVATSNALGYAWQIPVVAITRFEIYEEKSKEVTDPKLVLLENIRDLVYAKMCSVDDCEYFVGQLEKLKGKGQKAKVIGEYIQDKDKIAKYFGEKNLVDDGKVVEDKDRAELIFKKGEKLLLALESNSFTMPVTPLYINKPNITVPKK